MSEDILFIELQNPNECIEIDYIAKNFYKEKVFSSEDWQILKKKTKFKEKYKSWGVF